MGTVGVEVPERVVGVSVGREILLGVHVALAPRVARRRRRRDGRETAIRAPEGRVISRGSGPHQEIVWVADSYRDNFFGPRKCGSGQPGSRERPRTTRCRRSASRSATSERRPARSPCPPPTCSPGDKVNWRPTLYISLVLLYRTLLVLYRGA
jgi:hypothetical protein